MKDRRVKQFFSRDKYQWERRGHKERENEGVYGRIILYSYMIIEE
jgi:hypothetical protein